MAELWGVTISFIADLEHAQWGPPDELLPLTREAADRLAALDPPPEAQDLHDQWATLIAARLAAAERYVDEVERQGLTPEEASANYTADVTRAGNMSDLFEGPQAMLTQQLFERMRPDPLAAYLDDVIRLELELGPTLDPVWALSRSVISEEVPDIATIEAARETLELWRGRWNELDPPSDARPFHDATADGLDELIATIDQQRTAALEGVAPSLDEGGDFVALFTWLLANHNYEWGPLYKWALETIPAA